MLSLRICVGAADSRYRSPLASYRQGARGACVAVPYEQCIQQSYARAINSPRPARGDTWVSLWGFPPPRTRISWSVVAISCSLPRLGLWYHNHRPVRFIAASYRSPLPIAPVPRLFIALFLIYCGRWLCSYFCFNILRGFWVVDVLFVNLSLARYLICLRGGIRDSC